MNEIKFPIDYQNIYLSYIYLLNKELEVIKKRMAIVQADYFFPIEHLIKDIYYETPFYTTIPNMQQKKDFFPYNKKERKEKNLVIGNLKHLEFLLEKTGFPYELNPSNLQNVLKNLFNGKFAYENCDLFGYQRKSELMWKDGIKVPNPEILELSDYDMRKYELVDETNKLAEFFPLLNEVDYRNPEAIFTPFEEEGQIRKRILQGGKQNA